MYVMLNKIKYDAINGTKYLRCYVYKRNLALMPATLCETPCPENHCAKVYRRLYNSVTSVLTFVQYINDSYLTAKLYILYKLNK